MLGIDELPRWGRERHVGGCDYVGVLCVVASVSLLGTIASSERRKGDRVRARGGNY